MSRLALRRGWRPGIKEIKQRNDEAKRKARSYYRKCHLVVTEMAPVILRENLLDELVISIRAADTQAEATAGQFAHDATWRRRRRLDHLCKQCNSLIGVRLCSNEMAVSKRYAAMAVK
jgi:hypothetical protein